MRNKTLFLVISFFAFLLFTNIDAKAEIISSPEPFDFNKGLLDDERIIKEITFDEVVYDNNIYSSTSAFYQIGRYVEFKHPVEIKSIFYRILFGKSNGFMEFEMINGESFLYTISQVSTGYKQEYLDVQLSGVTKITLAESTTSLNLLELDFFGLYDDAPVIPPAQPNVENVKNLKYAAKHNRVDLSWQLPQQENFTHVTISRRTIEKSENISVLDGVFGVKKAYAEETDYDPLFETNGTYFNDLTVKSQSEYEYKLATVITTGEESPGVFVIVKTPEEPVPQIEGGDYEKDENGDFLYTWKSPTTGKVKVLVDGKEYKTVNASLKKILIPAADMKYDIFNNPKVQLVPISEDGKEGTPTAPKPGGSEGGTGGLGAITIPFGVKELLETGFGLLKIVGPFLLLSLSLILFRPLRDVIRKALSNYRERRIHR